MAYNAAKHALWNQSLRDLARNAFAGDAECERLDLTYTNEALSGAHADFADVPGRTEQDQINMVLFIRDFRAFLNGGEVTQVNRMLWLTPYLSGD